MSAIGTRPPRERLGGTLTARQLQYWTVELERLWNELRLDDPLEDPVLVVIRAMAIEARRRGVDVSVSRNLEAALGLPELPEPISEE